jgi:hypothetical protein
VESAKHTLPTHAKFPTKKVKSHTVKVALQETRIALLSKETAKKSATNSTVSVMNAQICPARTWIE